MVEVYDHEGEGFKALVEYGDWRVALLHYLDDLQPEQITKMERHTATDEVFVLIHGKGVLLVGGIGANVDGIYPQVMEPSKIYNVKRNVWHTILLSRDASVLLVENRDTGRLNSEYTCLSLEQRHSILEHAHHFGTPGA